MLNIFFTNGFSKKLLSLIFSFSVISISGFTQSHTYTVANAHAHNDYMHPVPFFTAFNAGFRSIEADVFPRNGVLIVAHSEEAIQPQRTLEKLYLRPLLHELQKDSSRKVNLLIDLKENYKECLHLLMKELEPLKKYLVTEQDSSKPVTILISGERPPPSEYKNYPNYIFFDDDLMQSHSPEEWKRVGLVSLSFERYSKWNGEGILLQKDKDTLMQVIDSVHNAGKKIRFWAAPDNPNSWLLQMKMGVDFIGTDKISEFKAFLENKNQKQEKSKKQDPKTVS